MIPVLEKVHVMPVRPTRPCMPVGKLTYADWLAKYRQELIEWFMFCYQRSEASAGEWADYCHMQFLAEQEFDS